MKQGKITIPTAITLLRIALVVPFMICLEKGGKMMMVALAIFVVAAISDFLDGFLARSLNQRTDAGAFLDPLADKMLVNLAFVGLYGRGLVPLWAVAIIVARDFAVDGIRMNAAKHKVVISASIWGKAKTFTQMVTIAVMLFGCAIEHDFVIACGEILLCVAVALTVISGWQYIAKGWKMFLS